MNRGNTVAVLGGTFNPVHNGHLAIARAAMNEMEYQTVIFVPAMIPVHKRPDTSTAACHRLAMLRIAAEEIAGVEVDDCEIRRGGYSYTIETIEHVYETYRFHGKPGLIIGDDLIRGFEDWRRVDELVDMVDLIVARRTRSSQKTFSFAHRYLHNAIEQVASSEIRDLVKKGNDVKNLVPPGVAEYIKRHDLYS
jgi:nicotinate-nucleotide adenylyltransferase